MFTDDLPVAEFGFPGPLRDQLVAAIVAGIKTTTTGLVADYEHEQEELPHPGMRQVVVDSGGKPVAVIETIAVRVMPLAEVDLAAQAFRLVETLTNGLAVGRPPQAAQPMPGPRISRVRRATACNSSPRFRANAQ